MSKDYDGLPIGGLATFCKMHREVSSRDYLVVEMVRLLSLSKLDSFRIFWIEGLISRWKRALCIYFIITALTDNTNGPLNADVCK